MKRTGFKWKPRKPLRRTRLRVVGHSSTSEIKRDIQALLRLTALARDKTCVLHSYPEAGQCGGYARSGGLILQAEHLLSRSNSATFADMRNIVLLCKYHHIFWKPQNSKLYWELIEEIVGEERWEWLKRAEEDRTPHKVDWVLSLIALKQELRKISPDSFQEYGKIETWKTKV